MTNGVIGMLFTCHQLLLNPGDPAHRALPRERIYRISCQAASPLVLALLVVVMALASTPSHGIRMFIGTAPAEIEVDVNTLAVQEYPEPVQLEDFSFSSHFIGQDLDSVVLEPSDGGNYPLVNRSFETVSGEPAFTGDPRHPLELGSQGINRNTRVADLSPSFPPGTFQTFILGGLLDVPEVATGALSFLFDTDVLIFGLASLGHNTPDKGDYVAAFGPGRPLFQFFDRTGRTVASIEGPGYDTDFWFQVPRGDDIRGVTITHDDYAGLAFYDFRFMVPSPSSLLLLLPGLLALAHSRFIREGCARRMRQPRPTGVA